MSEIPLLEKHKGWLAIDKPPGLLVIPGRTGGEATLRDLLEAQLGEKLFVVHRLDRDTSGVLLFARDAETHRALSMAFEHGQVEKHYVALVRGRWMEPVELNVPLVVARKGRMRPATPEEKGKDATTRFRPLEVFEDATWLEAMPLTGRTHQIRVHARAAGHPLLVDPHYGERGPWTRGGVSLERTPLHAASLKLPPVPGLDGARLSSPTPSDLMAVLGQLRSVELRAGNT